MQLSEDDVRSTLPAHLSNFTSASIIPKCKKTIGSFRAINQSSIQLRKNRNNVHVKGQWVSLPYTYPNLTLPTTHVHIWTTSCPRRFNFLLIVVWPTRVLIHRNLIPWAHPSLRWLFLDEIFYDAALNLLTLDKICGKSCTGRVCFFGGPLKCVYWCRIEI